MTEPMIELKGVSKALGNRRILDAVDLSIYEGQTTTIIGKSGVGKSVTLKHIIGLLEPDEGEIYFRGTRLRDMNRREQREMKRRFSYMFQNNALFDSMTVYENIALPIVEKGLFGKDETEQKVMSKIEQLELSEVTHKYPSQISGGMQKRVALARALVTEPHIVLFDEPTTGLDPIRKNAVLGMVAHYQRRFGFTAVVVSHDIPDIFFISNRIAILYDGKVIFQGSPFELEKFDHPLIEEFISSLRSLKDELTGLETKESFERQYQSEFSPIRAAEDFTVVLFSIDNLEKLDKQLGEIAVQKIIQSLAAAIDKYIGIMGISSRYSRGEILSVLPHMDREGAKTLLGELSNVLECQDVFDTPDDPDARSCFCIRAGLANGQSGAELTTLAIKAREQQELLAKPFSGQ
jgi:phospholipid/cholesterol/gamma-HCH transport system ATP-binding protein